MGVMIGFYGNWLIALVERLELPKTANYNLMWLFGFSLVMLLTYFLEAFTELQKQTWVKFIPLKTILGSTHLASMFALLWFSGIYESGFLFSWTGVALWVILLQVERRELA